jgi:glucose dehydrogenase
MTYSTKRVLTFTACMAAGAMILGAAPSFANEELEKLSKDPSQWVIPAGNYSSQRYSELKQINTSTAKNLRPVWTFSTGVLRGHEGGPLVVGNIMYLSTPYPNTVFALDLNENGKILWKYEPKQDPNVIPVMCCDTVNRGVAYG